VGDFKERSSIYVGGDTMSRAHRALLYAVGFTAEQIDKPLVAVVNTWNEIHAGHSHLNRLRNFPEKANILYFWRCKKANSELGPYPLYVGQYMSNAMDFEAGILWPKNFGAFSDANRLRFCH
jgi:hypothetical protein